MDFDDTIERILAYAKQAKTMTPDQLDALLTKMESESARVPPVEVTFSKIEDHIRAINTTIDKLESCFERMTQRVDRMIAACVERFTFDTPSAIIGDYRRSNFIPLSKGHAFVSRRLSCFYKSANNHRPQFTRHVRLHHFSHDFLYWV